MRAFLIALVLLISYSAANATTYYVDSVNGLDSNNGTSMGTPWQTIAKVNSSSFSGTDSVLFLGGDVWREQLTIPSGGFVGNPITFGQYGTGSPTINMSNVVTGWTVNSGSVWQAAVTSAPHSIYFNGVLGTRETSLGAVTAPSQWYWAANVLYTFSVASPTGVEAPTRPYGVTCNLQNWLVIQNFNVIQGDGVGIFCNGNSVIIASNTINNIYSYLDDAGGGTVGDGIVVTNSIADTVKANVITNADWAVQLYSSGSATETGTDVIQNTASNIGYDCLSTFSNTGNTITNITFEQNVTHNCSQLTIGEGAGVHFSQGAGGNSGTNNIARYNISYNNGNGAIVGFGFGADPGTANIVFYGNVGYGSNGGCFYAGPDTNISLYNNSCYGNTSLGAIGQAEFAMSGTAATNIIAENNIFVASTTGYNMYIPGADSSTAIVNFNYNIYSGGVASPFYWSGTPRTFSQWQAATTLDTKSLSADPKFTTPSAGLLNLLPNSPAINVGLNLGSTYQLDLTASSSWSAGVTTANQNLFGIGWEIGAYVYQGAAGSSWVL